jgi:dihydrofolate reductase
MGSGVLIGSVMAANLIDEYLMMIHPLVLGAGRRLSRRQSTCRCGSPAALPRPPAC